MKYQANPVIIEAHKISHVVEYIPEGIKLCLENGEVVLATNEMISRMKPSSGDYWVKQEDGYIYLNPKDVFERKYSKIIENQNDRIESGNN